MVRCSLAVPLRGKAQELLVPPLLRIANVQPPLSLTSKGEHLCTLLFMLKADDSSSDESMYT